jgi:hypothetical protein
MNIDPLAEDYQHQTTYAFCEYRVIDGRELEGLERVVVRPPTPGELKQKTPSVDAQRQH